MLDMCIPGGNKPEVEVEEVPGLRRLAEGNMLVRC